MTEHILTKMGKEGLAIRKRLKTFYRTRTLNGKDHFEQAMEAPVCEVTPN